MLGGSLLRVPAFWHLHPVVQRLFRHVPELPDDDQWDEL
jgi:hypothetical protein